MSLICRISFQYLKSVQAGNWCEMAVGLGADDRGDFVLIPDAQDNGVGPCRIGPGNMAVIAETKLVQILIILTSQANFVILLS